MSTSKTVLEVAATGITFEQIRINYFTELNQHTRANEARHELVKWQSRFDAAWLNQGEEAKTNV